MRHDMEWVCFLYEAKRTMHERQVLILCRLGSREAWEAWEAWNHRRTEARKSMEARNHGSTKARKHKSTEARKHGNTEQQKHGRTETQTHGNMDAEAPKHGSTEAWSQNFLWEGHYFLLYIAVFLIVFECTWTKYFCSCFLVHRLLVNESWLAMIALHIILFLRLRKALAQHIYTVLHWQSPKKIVHVS